MLALGLWLIASGPGLFWWTAALGLFLCGLGLRLLAVGLWRGADQPGTGTLRLMRISFLLYLASGLAAVIAPWVYLQLAGAIVVSFLLSIWIWLWAWVLVVTRKSAGPAA